MLTASGTDNFKISRFFLILLLSMVLGDVLGVMGFVCGLNWIRELIYAFGLSVFFLQVISLKNSKNITFFQMAILALGVFWNLLFKPVMEIQNIIYPFSFAIFVALIYSYELKINEKKIYVAAAIYMAVSMTIDGLMLFQKMPAAFSAYYAHRGSEIDPQYILPGIHDRRFIQGFLPFRLSGAVIDPLAHGIILTIILAWQCLNVRRKVFLYLFGLSVIFILTESRSTIVFGLGYLVLKSIKSVSIKNILKNPLVVLLFIGILVLMYTLETGESSHLKGIELQGFDFQVLLGETSYWLSPRYVESGLLFLFSGIGLLAIPLLAMWFHFLSKKKLNDARRAAFMLLLMIPIHYYLFNIKILSCILIFMGTEIGVAA